LSLTGRQWRANRKIRLRGLQSVLLALAVVFAAGALLAPAQAAAETRTLKLYFTHTGERAEITFKRNGRYVRSGLNKLNRFLRDHRRNEPTNMDPELFDLVWEVYRASGARGYIHVVSAYRSPATNAMLRRTRGGQARRSQHTLGKAMDFFIPGVPTRKLRELGFKLQGGGVGYYPKSATPFVHLDTGNVRAWPRMSRSELTRLFPDGKTLHLPPDGRRLPGYQQALAAYNARERSGQPATFGRTRRGGGGGNTERGSSGGGGGGNLLANLFGRDNDDNASASASRPSAPSRRQAAPETPGTALAALSRRDLPRPGAAPRAVAEPVAAAPAAPAASAPEPAAAPQAPDTPPAATSTVGLRLPVPRALIPGVRVGDPAPAQPPAAATPAPVAAPEAPPAAPTPAQPEGPATLLAALTPPVPRDRPAFAVASAEPLTIRQTGPQAEPSGDQATALLAAADAETATPADETPTLLAALPAPAPRPTDAPGTADPLTQLVAYAPVEPMVPPTTSPPAEDTTGRGDRIVVPAQRPDRADEDAILAAALDTGVTTTAKSARPSARDAVSIQPPTVPVVPADQIDPARFGDWAVSVASVTAEGRPTERPEFLRNATRTAPEAVYTAGFSKAPPPDPSRLSGNAVTFLAVARFDGGQGGGDGQPLQLQIPATN
jgi:uncharacterized protein YcbK (DUF882 family)